MQSEGRAQRSQQRRGDGGESWEVREALRPPRSFTLAEAPGQMLKPEAGPRKRPEKKQPIGNRVLRRSPGRQVEMNVQVMP